LLAAARDVWASCEFVHSHYLEAKDKGLYLAPDRILAAEVGTGAVVRRGGGVGGVKAGYKKQIRMRIGMGWKLKVAGQRAAVSLSCKTMTIVGSRLAACALPRERRPLLRTQVIPLLGTAGMVPVLACRDRMVSPCTLLPCI
jgi:hypothetical protein